MSQRLFMAIFTTTLVVLLLIASVEYNIPFIKKIEYDATCSQYFKIMIAKGGLDQTDRARIQSDLATKGYEVVSISAPESSTWGDTITLEILSNYKQDFIQKDTSHKSESYPFHYKKQSAALSKE